MSHVFVNCMDKIWTKSILQSRESKGNLLTTHSPLSLCYSSTKILDEISVDMENRIDHVDRKLSEIYGPT